MSQFQGIIPVKMFDTGQVFNFTGYPASFASWRFDGPSLQPIMFNGVFSPAIPVIGQMNGIMMGVGGDSTKLLNPVAGNGGNAGSQTYIDGYTYFYGLPSVDGGDPTLYNATVWSGVWNRPTGNYPPTLFESSFSFHRMLTIYTPLPQNFNYAPCVAGLYEDLSQDIFLLYFPTGPGATSFGRKLQNVDQAGWRSGSMLLGARNPYGFGQYDNSIFVSNTAGQIYPNRVILYNSLLTDSAGLSTQPVILSDVALDAFFSQVQSTCCFAIANGYLFTVHTNGVGPTGQREEIIIMNWDCSKYWLLKFIPIDPGVTAGMTRGTGWQVKIDSDGIIWFNPTAAADATTVYYSYSPKGFDYPGIYLGNLGPLVLPCFNTCQPVSWINQ